MNEHFVLFLSNLKVHSQADFSVFPLSASISFHQIQQQSSTLQTSYQFGRAEFESSRLKLAVAADRDVRRGGPSSPRPGARAAVAVLWAPGAMRGRALEVCVVLRGGTFGRTTRG